MCNVDGPNCRSANKSVVGTKRLGLVPSRPSGRSTHHSTLGLQIPLARPVSDPDTGHYQFRLVLCKAQTNCLIRNRMELL